MEALYSASQVRAIDAAEIASGVSGFSLMERAGEAAFFKVLNLWPDIAGCIVLCGGGNNAGDGYILARLAHAHALKVTVYFTKEPSELRGDARIAADRALEIGVPARDVEALFGEFRKLSSDSVIVDALLGTGFHGALAEKYRRCISWVNQQNSPVFSLDLPSGVYADSGGIADVAVQADACLSFIGRKKGLYTGAGKQCAGRLSFDDLSASRDACSSVSPNCFLLAPSSLRKKLVRLENSHKGQHGHVAVIGGRAGTVGAGLLAAEASLRCGAGLTSLFAGEAAVAAVHTRTPEIMALSSESAGFSAQLRSATVHCIGPGLGTDDKAQAIAMEAITMSCPKVLDADGLNLLADKAIAKPNSDFVITPHPGEAARMLGTTSAEIQKDRFGAAQSLYDIYGAVVVLKGAGTVIYDGRLTLVCEHGNPGMAVGGMGDVLAGTIAALLAQGMSVSEAAQLGTWAHSRAADLEVEKKGLIGLSASDLIPTIRQILNGNDF